MQLQYNQKVLEHFRKPKNMGEINNPDGEGVVGNVVCGDVMKMMIKVGKRKGEEYIKAIKFQTLGCLPAEEKVVLSEGGWREISKVSKGLAVLNSNGQETPVAKTYMRKYKGPLLTMIPFVSPFNSFSLTPEHPVFCIKRKWLKKARRTSSKCDWLRIDEKELISATPDDVKANLLEKGDYLVFSFNRRVVDNKLFNKKMMRLLGYYLSEGYLTDGRVVNFAFNRNEERLIKEVKSLILDITGKKTSERTRGSVTEVRFCSARWTEFLDTMAGKLARKKTLSLPILLLPFEKQWEMIETYQLGDGDVYRRRPHNSRTYRMITTSENLAIQLQEMLARGGIFASIREIFKNNCFIDGRKLKDSIQYLISFKLRRKHKFVHEHKRDFFIPIRKINVGKFKGLVYNFQVGFEPNSYLVRGFAVHNCGAAIATSSILTEMAKGKSLEEAMKIKNEDVLKALGGLPAIKLHCSVLAVEALRKAIRDYRKKK